MTREEAIKQLKDNRVLCINSETEPFAIAYDMAIETLAQEPCEDAVNRNAIRFKIAEMPKYTDGKKVASIRALREYLEKELEDPIEVTQDACIGFTVALECIREFVIDLPSVILESED